MMVGVLSLVGCTAPQGYKVAVSQCSSGQWRDKVNQEMLAAQHLYDHDVRLTIANSFDDAALQARQIDSLSQTDIDLLVVAPNEESADMAEALRRVHAKGIPVIFFDRKVEAVPYTAFIGGNNVEAGRIVGNYVVSEGPAMGRGKGPADKPFVLEITGAMTTSPAPRSQDTIFAETLNAAIVRRMSDPNLKMDDLGDEVGLSRVQLYRKVKAITGLTPVELLRKMRLQQGYVLLATTTKTVQEIAYEVGFGTPGYFSKCFRQQYGKNPMDVRNSTNET